jgi:hypothetical protein
VSGGARVIPNRNKTFEQNLCGQRREASESTVGTGHRIPGWVMFWKWHAGTRPTVRGVRAASLDRVEDHLARGVVLLHGVLAFGVVVPLVDDADLAVDAVHNDV